jgi:hypothetical protein
MSFAEEEELPCTRIRIGRHVDVTTDTLVPVSGNRHLRQRNRESAVRDIMSSENQAARDALS